MCEVEGKGVVDRKQENDRERGKSKLVTEMNLKKEWGEGKP